MVASITNPSTQVLVVRNALFVRSLTTLATKVANNIFLTKCTTFAAMSLLAMTVDKDEMENYGLSDDPVSVYCGNNQENNRCKPEITYICYTKLSIKEL